MLDRLERTQKTAGGFFLCFPSRPAVPAVHVAIAEQWLQTGLLDPPTESSPPRSDGKGPDSWYSHEK